MPLTPQFVAKVQPDPKRRLAFADRDGLSLIVHSGGSKVWSLRYRDAGGEQRRVLLGTVKKGMSLAAARIQGSAVRTQAHKAKNETAVDPHIARQAKRAAAKAKREALTFNQLADRYLEEWAAVRKRPRSLTDDRSQIRAKLRPRWGNRMAASLTKADVVAATTAVPGTGAAKNGLHRLLSKMFRWAASESLIPSNPMADLSLPAPLRSRDRVLSVDELRTVWQVLDAAMTRDEAADQDDDDQLRPELALWLKLRLLTAQRGQEVMAMRWADISPDTRGRYVWTIPAEVMKGKRPHVVPLSPWVMRLLDDRKKTSRPDAAYVLDGVRGKKQHAAGIGASLPVFGTPWQPHDLRRTAATEMGRLGVSRFIIARVLGHADTTVTGIYDRFEYLPEKREALDRWAKELARLLGVKGMAPAKVIRHPASRVAER